MYGASTASGTKRKHLFTVHLDDWVSSCDDLKIKITAKEAQPFVHEYRARQGQPSSFTRLQDVNEIPPFSNDTFIDAIVDFIVADDQVSPLPIPRFVF